MRARKLGCLRRRLGMRVRFIEREIPEDKAQTLPQVLLDLLNDRISVSTMGAFIISILHQRACSAGITLDAQTLEYVLRRRIEAAANQVESRPEDLEGLQKLHRLLELAGSLPFSVNRWQTQNTLYTVLTSPYQGLFPDSDPNTPAAESWTREAAALRDKLNLRVP